MEKTIRKWPRVVGAIIILLIVLFFAIEYFIREAQEFSPSSVTNILLSTLQIIVLLLFLILFFVLGRNLIKLYSEKKRKVVGAHLKTRLLLFFIALSLIPTLLLFFFASDLISRNIEQWFKTPLDKILDDTKSLADGFYMNIEEITLHYARQLSSSIQERKLISLERQLPLMEFVRDKLTEYKLDEVSIFLDDEELFSYLNPDLPLQYYRDPKKIMVKRAHLGEVFSSILPMGKGEMVRRGISFAIPEQGNLLVVAGKFLPQNYAQRINNITSYVQRYRQLKIQKNPVKTFYLITLLFITLLIVFAASWIAFHLAKGIVNPIEKLAHATREVSRGNLGVRVEDPASDELGMLIDSFNQMISDLRTSQQDVHQKTSELEVRKQYIETVLNNITTGVITLDGTGLITTINPSARQMLALDDRNVVGQSFKDVLREPVYSEIVSSIESGLSQRKPVSEREIRIDLDSQTTILVLTLSPLQQAKDEFSGLIVVLDNLTQLIKAQKIAAWKEVAQRVAHEIKNPLTPIQLSAERIIKNLGRDGKEDSGLVKEGASTIVREARTIKSLVDEFSNFARMPTAHLQAADIHEIIEQTISLYVGVFKNIEFETAYSSNVPQTIRADAEQMKRVFTNLFDNAIDAMGKKGKIKVHTSYDQPSRRLRIEVTDLGPGISLKDKDKLFLPHFSTKKKGMGLGLAIVNQVISEHNGSIDVENNQPQGAKFIIQIPA